ncbi:hypothetical protein A2U01_0014000 [Trifolium medium]|uniref:Uncharacterized protein n=1 Tax=Trifolium medium TaxID=97028 RepID=A0A392N0E2_9FABA|nr:hypothetical protein [Trifolium medium]
MKLQYSIFLVTLAILLATSFSSDPDSLQDLCVADLSSEYSTLLTSISSMIGKGISDVLIKIG